MHAFFVSYALRVATAAEHPELCSQLAPAFAAVPGQLVMDEPCGGTWQVSFSAVLVDAP